MEDEEDMEDEEVMDDDGLDADGLYADEYFYDSDRSSYDRFAEWAWLEQIDGVANVNHNQVADCDAKLIRREEIRRAFWMEMEDPSEGSSDLAFELFDRYGRLNREYYDHEIRKGSGAWGQELDHGDILLFESLSVKPLWRHQRIGTKIVKAVLDKVRAKSTHFFAFAQPGCLTRELSAQDLRHKSEDGKGGSRAAEKQFAISEHFWRSLGFRRVGASGWLAFTDDSSHPSRHLDAAEDWNTPERSKEEKPIPESNHTVLRTLLDPSALEVDCIRQIQEVFPVEANAPSPLYTDRSGNTILHIAAVGKKAETISYILTEYPHLRGIRNAECHTPLEALQCSLEQHRTIKCSEFSTVATVSSDEFEGFSQSDIACLAALTGTEIFDLAKLSNQDISAISSATDDVPSRISKLNKIRYTLRLKYGCTCGECIGGFISPRMHFALLCEAQMRHSILKADLDASGADWVARNARQLRYLVTPIRQNMKTDRSMRQGFTNICEHIVRCLREKRVPDEESVLQLCRNETSEGLPVTTQYLQQGGTIAAVANILFNGAMHEDEWAGDGMHLECHEDEIKKLPVCRNDHDFGFVSGVCGYKRVSTGRRVDFDGREIETLIETLAG